MATTVESLRKAIGKRKNSRAFAWLADLMRQNGDLDLALEYVRAGLSSTPCEEGNLVLSRILVEKGDWDGVVEACEYVLLRNPYCLSAIRRLGDAYAEKGDLEKRNLYYRRLHDLDPLDAFWKEEYAPKIEIPESGEAENPAIAAAETSATVNEVPVAEPEEKREPPVEESQNSAEEKDDDPFSSLSTLLPADEENDNEVSFDDLAHSLDDAIAGLGEAKPEKDAFPTDEIDGDDISTALSGIFGSAETEDSFSPTVKAVPEEAAPRPEAEDKPQSLSDAFDSIFGEDELPEEFVLSKPSASLTGEPKPVPPASVEESASDKAPAPAEDNGPLFEKSATQPAPANEGTLEKSVESSFDSLFGSDSDDLPLETLDVSKPASFAPVEESASDKAPAPAEDDAPLFEKSATQPAPAPAPANEGTLEKSVESSFDSLFGSDSDDLPLETLDVSKPASFAPVEESASDKAPAPAEDDAPLFEKSAPQPAPAPANEGTLEKSVESSFDSLFGSDSDDALVEDPTTSTRTLAEIYFEQGVYDEAIKIYRDLLRKSPDDANLKERLSEIEKIREDGKKEN